MEGFFKGFIGWWGEFFPSQGVASLLGSDRGVCGGQENNGFPAKVVGYGVSRSCTVPKVMESRLYSIINIGC